MTDLQAGTHDTSPAGVLVAQLRALDIVLAVEGERLLVNAPKGSLSAELRAQLGERKPQVIEFLRNETRSPLSFSQQRLWLLSQLDQQGAAYHVGGAMRLIGELDIPLMERALSEIVRRHATVRTTFEFDGDLPVQVIHPATPVRIQVVPVDTPPDGDGEQALAELLIRERALPFDLKHGPLWRAVLFRVKPNEHVLASTMHHIVADGWSLGILAHELRTLMEAFRAGLPSPLPELTYQYTDHARWQHHHLQGPVFEAQLDYWKTHLAGDLPNVELTTDRPRPPQRSVEGRIERFELPADIVAGLQQLATKANASLFMVLLAGFKVLLHRHTGQLDLVVGTPIANRTRLNSEQLIGFFANTLVLRTKLEQTDSFGDVVERVRAMTLDAYANQDVPFEKLVEVLRPARDAARTPLFQIMFALQNVPDNGFTLPGLITSSVEIDRVESKGDLVFMLNESPSGIKATIEFAAEIFDRSTIRRLWQHFDSLLRAALNEPGTPIGALPMLDNDETRQLVVEFNGTSVPADHSRTIVDLIRASTERNPAAHAVSDARSTLTYEQLDQQSDALAVALEHAGATTGARVAICADRTVAMVVSMLAVLKSGAAYVPLDASHPVERLQHILEDADVCCAITQTHHAAIFASTTAQIIDLDAIAPAMSANGAQQNAAARQPRASASDLAYLIYTSGSTGRPKGVEVEHRNLIAFLDAMRAQPGITSDDTLLAITTLAFDIAGLEIWLPLSAGAHIRIASRDEVQDAKRLMQLIDTHAVTLLQATPATWRALLEAQWTGKSSLKALVGGEAVPRDLVNALAPRVGSLWNMYGPTETTIWSTLCQLHADHSALVSIGRPIHNTRVYVLEPSGLPAAIGVVGELCIAGAGVARGYRNLRELTGERFALMSIPLVGTERVYRTGDLASWRQSGVLDFAGRRDEQVKLRGYRIELGEIEAALLSLPGVHQAAVVTRTAGPDDVRLAAFVVIAPGFSLTVSEIRTHLRKSIPDYMVPAAVIELDALPLSPNGKVARKALPNPFVGAARPSSAGEPPAPGIEQSIAAIWTNVLGVTAVGAYDNFFELGGHSLLALRVVTQMRERLGWEIDPREMFFKSLRQIAVAAPRATAAAAARPSA